MHVQLRRQLEPNDCESNPAHIFSSMGLTSRFRWEGYTILKSPSQDEAAVKCSHDLYLRLTTEWGQWITQQFLWELMWEHKTRLQWVTTHFECTSTGIGDKFSKWKDLMIFKCRQIQTPSFSTALNICVFWLSVVVFEVLQTRSLAIWS